jgi:hypothetical protein
LARLGAKLQCLAVRSIEVTDVSSWHVRGIPQPTGQCLLIAERMIREKIASNYIYSTVYTDEHDTTQFNIVLEFAPPNQKTSECSWA